MILLASHNWDLNLQIVAEAGAATRYAGRIVFLTINTAKMPQVLHQPLPCRTSHCVATL